jgi:DNA-binding Lrp family transcriptional regulator
MMFLAFRVISALIWSKEHQTTPARAPPDTALVRRQRRKAAYAGGAVRSFVPQRYYCEHPLCSAPRLDGSFECASGDDGVGLGADFQYDDRTLFEAEQGIMVTAIVLIQTRHGRTKDVAEALAAFPEISEVYSVGGSYDVVALVRVKQNEDIADMVTERMVKVEGIERTETMIAFKTYSRHDLENVFSLGLE